MTRSELVLFSGGPAIYAGEVPKPLQVLSGGRTLLELYLNRDFASTFDSIKICCESNYANAFGEVLERFSRLNISLNLTPPESTTLEKLSSCLTAGKGLERNLVCTYPDIFYFGSELPILAERDLTDRFVISVRPLESRLPRLMIDPYSGMAKSISMHRSPNPANPIYMYGGHLFAHSDTLARVIDQFNSANTQLKPILEVEVFSWMISRNLVDTAVLQGEWIQCDSPRDQSRLMTHIETDV
jgi:hypothetical protein